MKNKVVILGAGPAGISAAYHLNQMGIQAAVYEKKDDYGGLCGGFDIGGFHFDYFAHLTFSKNLDVNKLLEEKTPYLVHAPEAMNYYEGKWIRNPVQTNLNGLDVDERIEVISDFVNRRTDKQQENYGAWLRQNYGTYFAEHFPVKYTKKYWTVEPEQLETLWVKQRMYVPSLKEILRGAFEEDTPNVHYSKEMHYPKQGGFRRFLEPLAEEIDIRYRKEVVAIDFEKKKITFSDHTVIQYETVINTLPICRLPEFSKEIPLEVKQAAGQLDYTSGYMISLGINKKISFPTIWFYIYDEDILPARVYFPDKKACSNVPEGCSSLQAEVYVSKYKKLSLERKELIDTVTEQLQKMGLFQKKDILVSDIRYEEFANIMFTPQIYSARRIVKDYLGQKGVINAGRFGEWDYLWLEQSLLSGKAAAEQIVKKGS